MLHVTQHFDAGDIDKFNSSPVGKSNIVYHSKKRFKSPEINMHYSTTFEAVGGSTGDHELDLQRFRTTMREEHNETKVAFGASANPPTVFEKMAKQSRLKAQVDGRPRGLLAHEDHSRGRNSTNIKGPKSSLLESGFAQTSSAFNPGTGKTQRNSLSVMHSKENQTSTWGRYAANKKNRKDEGVSRRSNSLVDVHHNREVLNRQKKLYQQAMRVKAVNERAPHVNIDSIVLPKQNPNTETQTTMAKQNIAKYNAAREFGLKSLYGNDVTKQMNAMNQTMAMPFHEPLMSGQDNFDPMKISPSPSQSNAYKLAVSQRKKAQSGSGAIFGNNPHTTSYALTNGDPFNRYAGKHDSPSQITKAQYDELLKSTPYVPESHGNRIGKNDTHASNILSSSYLQRKAMEQGSGPDLAEIERQNRFKYGVKKPANVWQHEMDDSRITGDQIRVNKFRGSMFERDRMAQLRAATQKL